MDFQWFEILENDPQILQGDLIPSCPIVIPPKNIKIDQTIDLEIKLIDSIILSQSCDLIQDKLEIVLVCPYFKLSHFIASLPPEEQTSKTAVRKRIDSLRKGYFPPYHLINKSTIHPILTDYHVVDFKNVYGIQLSALKNIVLKLGTRTRLLPPYREHLSQAFARYFMRVGLPQDINVEGY